MSAAAGTRRLRLGAVVVAAAALIVLVMSTPAQAHTELEQERPADGATLEKLPPRAVLVFSEEVLAEDLTVKVAGKSLPVEAVPAHPRNLRVDLRSVRPSETVRLSWKVIDSHDGHETEGVVELHVGKDDGAAAGASQPAAAPPSEPRTIRWAEVTARITGYLAMAVLIGGLLFVSLLWPAGAQERRTKLVLGTSVAAGVLSAVADVAVVVWRADGSLTWSAALNEDYGRAYAALALLWGLAAVVVVGVLQGGSEAVRRLPWRVGALAVSFGLIRTTGMNAHATEAPDAFVGAVADFLHLTAISAWVGGLTVLTVCLLPRRRLAELEEIVPKFSKVALVSVLLIVSSGLVLVWQMIASVDGFWATHYSRVLLVKLSIFVVVLLAAMKSKRWVEKSLASAVATRRRTAVRSLAASVAAETVLVVAVLGAASVLATSSPGI